MNRLFDEPFFRPFDRWPWGEEGVRTLALDVYETDEDLVVEAPLPGLQPNEVDISVVNNTLTIKGEMKEDKEKTEKGKYYWHEHRYETVQRTITLPVEVDADKAKAVFKDGLLKLTLPKLEEVKPKHIEVKAK
jgi:HSP20 family protein